MSGREEPVLLDPELILEWLLLLPDNVGARADWLPAVLKNKLGTVELLAKLETPNAGITEPPLALFPEVEWQLLPKL